MESASLPVGLRPPPPPPPAAATAKKTGDGFLDEAGHLTVFCLEALRALPGSLRYFSEIMRINAIITRRTTVLLFIMCGFLGMSASNFGFFFLRSIGASDFVGIVPGLLTPRQIAPQMFGYVFAGSVCCAIAAELGSARIQEEIDAYESQGIDTMKLLVGTRILAVLLFVPLASAVAMFGNFAGSFLSIVVILHGNNAPQFVNTFFSIFPAKSLFYCTVSVGLVALQCSLVACFYGMTGKGAGVGPAAVGGAVARSLAINLVLLHFVVSLVALAFYGGSLGIPIAGS